MHQKPAPDNGEFIISLDRINDSGQDVTITFEVGGNAIAGVGNDYQTIPNTVVIGPGVQDAIIPVIVFKQ